MKMQQRKRILLVGFEDDIRGLASQLSSTSADIMQLTERTTNTDVPRTADIAVYVMSVDSGFSTQLHSIFVYIHDRVLTPNEYLLAIGDVDLAKASFSEISHLPQISIGDLKKRLESEVRG